MGKRFLRSKQELSMGKKRKDGWRENIDVVRLDGGELWVNRGKGLEGVIETYVRGGDPYRAEVSPVRLEEAGDAGERTTKVEVPGIGTCVLEEKPAGEGGYRQTFEVAMAARVAEIDTYVPYACWEGSGADGGQRAFLLREWVEGETFEKVARGEGDREKVAAGYRSLGIVAALLNDHWMVNADVVPRKIIRADNGRGGWRWRPIGLGNAYFSPRGETRRVFVHRMRALRRVMDLLPEDKAFREAFLDAYGRGDGVYLARCRKALELLRRHGQGARGAALAWLTCPPAWGEERPLGARRWVRNECIRLLGGLAKEWGRIYHAFRPRRRFSLPKEEAAEALPERELTGLAIPRVVWQTNFSEKCTLPVWLNWKFNRWMSKGFAFRYCDNDDISEFIRKNLGPREVAAFERLTNGAAKADFWRMAVLVKEGGVYFDVDATLFCPLRKCLAGRKQLLIAAHENRVTNYFLASEPGNPLFRRTLEIIVENIENFAEGQTVYTVTGPQALQMAVDEAGGVEFLPRNRVCHTGVFTNEHFQYLDKPGSKWNQQKTFIKDGTEGKEG